MDLKPLEQRICALESKGRTVVAVARDGALLGLLALGDALRDDAPDTIRTLQEAGVRTVLITGDNKRTATRIAEELGLDAVHAEVLPGEKADMIRELQKRGRTAMVGDGINDAPALMQADVGIAMGSGTDIAIDAADIIILNNRISNVVEAREISRQGYAKMLQNVSLALPVQRHWRTSRRDGAALSGVGDGRHGGERNDHLRPLALGASAAVLRRDPQCGTAAARE